MTSSVTRPHSAGITEADELVPNLTTFDAAPDALANGREALRRRDYAKAAQLLASCGGAAPGHDAVHRLFNRAVRGLVPRWHFEMLNDQPRNEAYRTAIRAALRPGDLVLDIGTGAGLLALLAAQEGAELVVTCEMEPVVAAVARQVMADNGVADRVRVISSASTQLRVGVDLPRRADLLITEIFDCALLGEGALPTLTHARGELLAADARLVPGVARLWGQLVHSPRLYARNHAATVCGFDVTAFQRFRSMEYFDTYLHNHPHRLISEPFPLFEFDFAGGAPFDRWRQLQVPITDRGPAHAVVMWFDLAMGNGTSLSNSMADPNTHWRQAVQTFDRPLGCMPGDTVELTATHDDQRVLLLPGHRALGTS